MGYPEWNARRQGQQEWQGLWQDEGRNSKKGWGSRHAEWLKEAPMPHEGHEGTTAAVALLEDRATTAT